MSDFKKLHDGSKLLHLPNAWDAGSARLFESLGAPAIATTSAGVAWAAGYADGDNMPVDVAINIAASIARVLTVPLSVDFENGYSDDASTVAQNVLRLIGVGVAGINLEDGGGTPQLLAEKIAAIKKLAAQSGKDIFINTRTDVYLRGLAAEGERVAEVLKRAALYKEAGADSLFVPGICKVDEIKAVVAGAGLPVNVMDWPGVPSADDLHKLGVRRLSAGSGIPQALWAVAADMGRDFLATGSSGPLIEKAMPYGELQKLFIGARQ
ncbi:isocitrate lyase/phosphoenolpyruvate mutase family protein [Duganella sp. BJB488]|uniref:isocitrate lyase/PEP mutase family protein n=1 Tax=unclassified Duganella TaxID=2636909 RepID=UPI000E355C43|nr:MULTISPECIES: isocitrate lyase/phosphoenolpyruvate mutase family protein [unclassified Duganella]NVD70052.1 isocitrate lyase/phosphoenolpyruvate mutase family protein [Duganella sp. BJB1802]RFP23038.1 isocitrate lyase/phosphoenolpyruvate mutase family protein [Duganella sp. BJB489]RFP24885.1 isocitrate lyase/phosphoenolpyruvate mutase family protein [Duganella sp. BJB488]RFP34038.1 isocitrate lyase/phosphoenolpyruvate mutase family protein [Duganella sp. BJB480]